MGSYAVEPAELERCDALLAATAGQCRVALARLQATANELLGAWHGAAGGAFQLGWEQWLDGATAMLAALDAMAAAIGSSGLEYAATEDAVRAGLAGAAP